MVVAGVGIAASVAVQAWAPPAQAAVLAQPEGDDAGILGPLNPMDGHGNRLDHYLITGDDGGMFDFGRKVMLFFTAGLFALSRWIVGLASWLVDWVLHFEIAQLLLGPVDRMIGVLDQHLIAGTGLAVAALTVAATICGLWFLRGHRSRATTEFSLTLVILAVAAVVVTNPAHTVFGADGLLGQARDLSLEVASLVTTGGDSIDAGEDHVSTRTRRLLTDIFIRAPHQMINYGTVLEGDQRGRDHRCLPVYEDILAAGAEEERPWERMAACDQDLADFNQNPTWDRLGAALLATVAALFVTVLTITIVLTLLTAQLWLVFETIRLLFALVLGVVPGPGRRLLWKALGGLAAALSAVVATVAFLALFTVLVRGLLSAANDRSLIVRFLLVDIAIFAGLTWYRQLIAATRTTAARISTRLGGRPASDHPPRLQPIIQRGRADLRQVGQAPTRGIRAVRHTGSTIKQRMQDFDQKPGRLRRWYRNRFGGLVHDAAQNVIGDTPNRDGNDGDPGAGPGNERGDQPDSPPHGDSPPDPQPGRPPTPPTGPPAGRSRRRRPPPRTDDGEHGEPTSGTPDARSPRHHHTPPDAGGQEPNRREPVDGGRTCDHDQARGRETSQPGPYTGAGEPHPHTDTNETVNSRRRPSRLHPHRHRRRHRRGNLVWDTAASPELTQQASPTGRGTARDDQPDDASRRRARTDRTRRLAQPGRQRRRRRHTAGPPHAARRSRSPVARSRRRATPPTPGSPEIHRPSRDVNGDRTGGLS